MTDDINKTSSGDDSGLDRLGGPIILPRVVALLPAGDDPLVYVFLQKTCGATTETVGISVSRHSDNMPQQFLVHVPVWSNGSWEWQSLGLYKGSASITLLPTNYVQAEFQISIAVMVQPAGTATPGFRFVPGSIDFDITVGSGWTIIRTPHDGIHPYTT